MNTIYSNRPIASFETETARASVLDIRVGVRVSKSLSQWGLESSLCLLEQYVKTEDIVCICDVVEQDTPAGPTTEFWLSVNSLNWDTIDDSEFIRYLTTFAGVDESDIHIQGFALLRQFPTPAPAQAPCTPTPVPSIDVPFSAVEVEVEFDLPQLSPSPQSNPCTAVVTPDDWRIDALITAWADIPADDGDVDVDVDLDDEYDEYDEDEYSQHGHAFEYEATPALEHYASSPLASPASPSEATPYPLLPLKPNTMAMPKAMHILKSQMPPTPSGRPWHWNASPGEPVFWPVPPL